MTIANGSILKDGTISVTGGTATDLSSLGNTLNQHHAYFDGTDYLTRSMAEFSIKQPKVSANAPNGYTQARSIMVIKSPLALDNGNTTFNSISINFACDVETTQAEKRTMLGLAAQMLSDSDFSDFWENQSTE